VIAVRATELLRDIYLDVPRELAQREAPPSPPAPPPPPASIAAVAPEPVVPLDRQPMRVFLGAAVLGGRRGLGPAIAPVLSVTVPVRYGFALAGTTAGPFSRIVGDADTGTASTTQALAAAGGRFEISFGPISPFFSLAGGVHFLRAEGTPSAMFQSTSSKSVWAPLFAIGTGISVWFRRWLAATAQVETFYTQPMTDIRVGGMVVGRAGGPSLLAQVGLSASLGER
jgi:hypothetical protein